MKLLAFHESEPDGGDMPSAVGLDDCHSVGVVAIPGAMRILLGVHDPHLRRALSRVLRAEGHWVRGVRDGIVMLDELASIFLGERSLRFDAIVAEHRLRGVLGLSLLAGLRQYDGTTPFVLIASPEDVTVKASARRLGADTLDEAFDPRLLPRLVSRIAGPQRFRGAVDP